MKYLICVSILLFSSWGYAQHSCQIVSQDVNTPVPNHLKGAKICTFKENTGYNCVPAEDFKIVKRKQQWKVTQSNVVEIHQKLGNTEEELRQVYLRGYTHGQMVMQNNAYYEKIRNKNLIMLGARYDQTNLNTKTDNMKVTVYSNKALILDLSYLRRRVLDTQLGLGLGIDTNGVPRGIVGYEF